MKTNKFLVFLILTATLFSACDLLSSGEKSDVKFIPYANDDGKYGYIDWNGKIVINPQFTYAGLFRNGLAKVRSSGEDAAYGFIDEGGKFIINPKFKEATDFSEKIAFVVEPNGAPYAIDPQGKEVFKLQQAKSVFPFSEGLAAFAIENEKGQLWGFVDNKGNTVINPQFESVWYFNEGLCAVMAKDGKWGFIDKKGTIVINYQFSNAGIFKNGRAEVSSGGKWGVIDKEGKLIVNPQFDQVNIDGDLLLVTSGDRIGWADKEGKMVINPQFNDAGMFNENLAPVKTGSSWGYIDKKGKIVINAQFEAASSFYKGKALVRNGNWGIIDKGGKYIANPQFDGVSNDVLLEIIAHGIKINKPVYTDYFDVSSIVSRVTSEVSQTSVAGLDFSTPLSQIMTKFPQHDISYQRRSSTLYENQAINKEARISLQVEGEIYIQSGSGWYYTYEPNPAATVNAFVYSIMLNRFSEERLNSVFKAFENAFSGFSMSKNDSELLFKGAKFNIKVVKDYDYIRLIVKPADAHEMVSGSYNSDTTAVDTTIIAQY